MQPSIEIIICFRNRDLNRIRYGLQSLAAQTDKNFSVLFLDYGSNQSVSKSAAELCADFTFCNYLFADSEGKLWNRSQALNLGILQSRADYLFMADADLLY